MQEPGADGKLLVLVN